MTNTPTYDDLANIPQPAGATGMYEWCDPDQPLGVVATSIGPDTDRYFVGMSRTVSDDGEDIEVGIDGTHWADGACSAISWCAISMATTGSHRRKPAQSQMRCGRLPATT